MDKRVEGTSGDKRKSVFNKNLTKIISTQRRKEGTANLSLPPRTFHHAVLLGSLEVALAIHAVGELSQAAPQLPALVVLATVVGDVQQLQGGSSDLKKMIILMRI